MKQLLNTLLGSCALLALAGEPRASAQTGFWVGEPPMPTARGGLGTAVLNGQIYAIGGDNGSHLNTAESFDPISETWQSLAGMSTPRWVPGVAGVNGLIYAMGGYPRGGDDRVNSSMEAYNPANNTWSPVANMLTPRGNLGAVTVDGLIYAIGGNTSHTAFSEVEAYNPTTDSWTSKAHLPTARSGLGVAVAYGLIYAIGGSSPTYLSGCAVNEVYDPVADQWTTKASAPEILPDARVAAVNGILYVTGNTASPGRVYAYHPITDTWSTNASLLTPAIEQGWVTANGAVYSVGGIGNSQVLPTTEAFHPAYTPATATVVLANDPLLAHPLYLTGDGTNLFASGVGADSNQYIFRVPEDGGAATVWCPAFNPNGIAIVGSNIFWIDPNAGPGTDTEILRASVATGGSPNAIYVGLNAGQPIVDGDGLASDGQFLYAVDEVAGNVWRLQPDGGGLTQLGGARYAGGFGYEHVNNIAVSRGVVYVSDTGARAISPQVVSIATNGDSFSTLALGAPLVSPTGIAVGNGIAYVADPGANNTIWQIPIGGGTPVALVSGAPFSWLWSLAFVNGTLYVADRGNGTIYAIVVAPGGSKPLTPGSSGIQLAQGAGISISSTQLIAAASGGCGISPAVSGVTSPSLQGALVSLSAGQISYTPAKSFSGSDSFTYNLTDGCTTVTGTVSVTVIPDPLAAGSAAFQTAQGSTLTLVADQVLANATGSCGGSLRITGVSSPSVPGATVVLSGGSISYTPAKTFSGVDSFTYNLTDDCTTVTGTVSVTVIPDPLVAGSAAFQMAQGSTLTLVADQVLANATGSCGGSLRITRVDPVSLHGAAVALHGDHITYTPPGYLAGTDTFAYSLADDCALVGGTVTITIPATPLVAGAGSLPAVQGTSLTFPAAKIAGTASGGCGGAWIITGVSSPTPANADVSLAGGTLVYRAPNSFVGMDTINYTLTDGCVFVPGAISVTVAAGAAPPSNPPKLELNSKGVSLTFHGVPRAKYRVQWAAHAAGPWSSFSPVVTASNVGLIQYNDTTSPRPAMRIYRTVVSQ